MRKLLSVNVKVSFRVNILKEKKSSKAEQALIMIVCKRILKKNSPRENKVIHFRCILKLLKIPWKSSSF